MKIQDAVVLVTGANRGIGLAFTKALHGLAAADPVYLRNIRE
jgi:NAD(P)-dependent dehydrogenase (short-subunit alcohol dehydrogenase family)